MGTKDQIKNLKQRVKKRSGLSDEEPDDDDQDDDDVPSISEDDAEALLEFSRQLNLLNSKYTDYRHLKLLRHCVIMAEQVGGLADALESREAAEDVVVWINEERDTPEFSEETNQDYRVALRVFGKRVLKMADDEVPDSLAWVPTGTSNSYDPSPSRSDMLDWEEAKRMAVEGTTNPRDKALIAVSHELGPRGEESHNILIGQVTDADHGIQISLDGKQGEHSVTLINSVPYLQQWLREHPAPDDDEAYLWCNLDDAYDNASYQTFLKRFKKAGRRADIDKPVTPTNFRKSNTYWLAKQGANESFINERQGRTATSDHARRYIAAFGPENENNQYAELQGLDVQTEKTEDRTPLTCPRCNKQTPVLEFVGAHQPTSDELVGWHRGSFQNVSSRDSIMRRVSYLQQVGFLRQVNDHWEFGGAGREYVEQGDVATLLRIMCDRNVGLRSLMYALAAGPMTVPEVSEQQLDTHLELGWSRGETGIWRNSG